MDRYVSVEVLIDDIREIEHFRSFESGLTFLTRTFKSKVDLPEHEDGSPWSFVLPLNSPQEYDGGGTQFVELDGQPVFRPAQGTAVLFSGRNRHRGVAITRGVRYILAGFCGFVESQ